MGMPVKKKAKAKYYMTCPPKLWGSTNSSLRKNNAHFIPLQILLQMLGSIISHHKKSASISYNAKSSGNFRSSTLIHQCVESSEYTFLCIKLFSLPPPLPLYRVIKKTVKARCIKQKSKGHGPASAGVSSWFHWFCSRERCSQWLPLALCLRHLTLAGGEEKEGAVVEGAMVGVSEVSTTTPPPLQSPASSLPRHFSLALRLADSASCLWVLKWDRTGLCETTDETARQQSDGHAGSFTLIYGFRLVFELNLKAFYENKQIVLFSWVSYYINVAFRDSTDQWRLSMLWCIQNVLQNVGSICAVKLLGTVQSVGYPHLESPKMQQKPRYKPNCGSEIEVWTVPFIESFYSYILNSISNKEICIKQNEVKKQLTFCYIQIEEITVEDGLHHSSNNGNHVKESLKIEPPYPVDEVQGSVESQEEQVVGGDGLSFTCLADHEKLRQNGHRLQVDGESP